MVVVTKLLSFSLALMSVAAAVGAVTVKVNGKASHDVPDTLWSQMYEDINSGDGGLYAELLKNRAFQLVEPGTAASLDGWKALNGATISVIKESTPVSEALPNALQVEVPAGLTGKVGFANTGYSGIKVTSAWKYTASFYFRFPEKTHYKGNLVVGLQSSSGKVFAKATTAIHGSQSTWRKITVELRPTANATDTNNLFTIELDAPKSAGYTFHFAMLSLFPPTFKNRPNGMRIDLAEALQALKPGLFRFPGGNNLEGQTVERRWKWWNTVGDLVDRPGRLGDWTYVNTDGLGLLEYLYWCEDLEVEPIMGVWAGYALGGESVPEDELEPYIQEAIDQIYFAIGDPAKNKHAALRASLGRPKPFNVRYVEIGNEDWFAPTTYIYRWKHFATRIQKEFPHLRLISTTYVDDPVLDPVPTYYDYHDYNAPVWFTNNTFFYDDFPRDGKRFFHGEYAVITHNPVDIWAPGAERLKFPSLLGAVSEGAFMIGLERNSDIVFAAAYAPLIGHVTNTQWTPNLIAHDAAGVYLSTSYYVQKFFSDNRGDEYLPSTLPNRQGTVFWGVVRKKSTNEIIIKIANSGPAETPFTFILPFKKVAKTGTVQSISGTEDIQANSPADWQSIVPRLRSFAPGKTFNFTAPARSFSVLTFVAQ